MSIEKKRASKATPIGVAFDPFTATLSEAEAQPDPYVMPRGAVGRWFGAQELLRRREFFERQPLDGLAICAVRGLVPPEWLAKAYAARLRLVYECRVRSWDEVFGPPFPKNANLPALRRARLGRLKAATIFRELMQANPDRSIDKGLWEEIGERIGTGATRAEELYREALRMGAASTKAEIREAARVYLVDDAGGRTPAGLAKLVGLQRRR